jgi:hypothetical protein
MGHNGREVSASDRSGIAGVSGDGRAAVALKPAPERHLGEDETVVTPKLCWQEKD